MFEESTTMQVQVDTDLQIRLVDLWIQENLSETSIELIAETEAKYAGISGISALEVTKTLLFVGVMNEMVTRALKEQIERMELEGLLQDEEESGQMELDLEDPAFDDPDRWVYQDETGADEAGAM